MIPLIVKGNKQLPHQSLVFEFILSLSARRLPHGRLSTHFKGSCDLEFLLSIAFFPAKTRVVSIFRHIEQTSSAQTVCSPVFPPSCSAFYANTMSFGGSKVLPH